MTTKSAIDTSKVIQTNEVCFSFDTNGIDAKALAKILSESYQVFKGISEETSPEKNIEVKIYPFQKGSFEYQLAIVAAGTAAISLGAGIIEVFTKLLDYKKSKLDYQKDALEIRHRNEDEKRIEVNPVINIHLDGFLKSVSDNSDGFKLTTLDKKEIISLSSREIQKIQKIEADEKEIGKEKTREIEKGASLVLIGKSNKKYGMWEFIYEDIRIMASLRKIDKQQCANLPSGSVMTVMLQIIQRYNEPAKAWENWKYKIKFVLEAKRPS